MQSERLIWFNDGIVDAEKAMIELFSPSAQYGLNVFEGIRCYWNEKNKELYAFKLSQHIDRLLRSARRLKIDHCYDNYTLELKFIETVKVNKYNEDIIVRQSLYVDGMGSWYSRGPGSMFIAPIPMGRVVTKNKSGHNCMVSSWERINERSISPKIKCGANYMNSRMAQLEAIELGYDNAILLNREGTISEAAGACIFIVKKNKLITPPLSASILDSITRSTVLEIANNELNLEVEEKDLKVEELYDCDEAFLCGTAVEILPVTKIDKFDKNIGEQTLKISKLYLEIVRGRLVKYSNWLTPIYKS